MRWVLVVAFAAFVFFGCEDEESADTTQIVLMEAPTRLPFVEDRYRPQAFETTAVRFITKLVPAVTEIDTIVCNVYDFLGGKVDSFLLLDDGGLIEHWENTPCESALTGDSIAGDGLFTRSIHAEVFSVNYLDAEYTFVFRASHHSFSVRGAVHSAETWAPQFELVSLQITPEFIPPCEDSMVVALHVRRDSTDYIEGVAVGFPGHQNQLYRTLADFTALSGDSIWRAAVAHNNHSWADLLIGGLVIGISGRLGRYETMPISQFYSTPSPAIDLSHTADTFRVSAVSVPETLMVKVGLSLCPGRVPDRVAAEARSLNVPTNWTSTLRIGDDLNDCGRDGDEIAGDGIHTMSVIVIANELAQAFTSTLRVRAGATAHPFPCQNAEFVGATDAEKLITFLPPQ